MISNNNKKEKKYCNHDKNNNDSCYQDNSIEKQWQLQ